MAPTGTMISLNELNQNHLIFLLNKGNCDPEKLTLKIQRKKIFKIDPKEYFSFLQLADGSFEAMQPHAKHFQGGKGCKQLPKTNIKTERNIFLTPVCRITFIIFLLITKRVTKSVPAKFRLNILICNAKINNPHQRFPEEPSFLFELFISRYQIF